MLTFKKTFESDHCPKFEHIMFYRKITELSTGLSHSGVLFRPIQCVNPLSFTTVVDIGLMQTTYTTSEAMGSVSVCVNISSAELARNVSVTLRTTAAGAVGKPIKSHREN